MSVPVIVSPVFNTLSDAAPVRVAVIVPAEKFPEPSRTTILFGVLVLEIAAKFEFAIVAFAI